MEASVCKVYGVKVGNSYIGDTFKMKVVLDNDRNYGTWARSQTNDCSNVQKAASGMLCSHWAPQHASA